MRADSPAIHPGSVGAAFVHDEEVVASLLHSCMVFTDFWFMQLDIGIVASLLAPDSNWGAENWNDVTLSSSFAHLETG